LYNEFPLLEAKSMFKQIKVRHISEEVFDQIKTAILDGRLRPGDKLPTERELISQLRVSRLPIREALKLLANMGLIETRQGGGSYVRSLLADRMKDPLGLIMKDHTDKIFELLEVRKEVESWSAFNAAQRATAEEAASLCSLVEETKKYCDQGKKPPGRLDADFHLAVAQFSHNTIQAHLTHTIYDVFSEYFNYLIENICFNVEYQEAVCQQHAEICHAVGRKDSESAREAMLRHLEFVGGQLKKQVGQFS
jgi:GntR family transcriptional regulator, transcriptional repressor for pyruvate dehydrogenase complex